jgi:hypothetical protein
MRRRPSVPAIMPHPARHIRAHNRVGPGGDPVAAGIKKAKEAWDTYLENREYDKNAVYGYLTVVFDLVQQWKKKGVAPEYSLKALKRHDDSAYKMKPDPYARVIYCSSDDEPKMRSKWANIMQWVAENNKNARPFTEFVNNNGGLNKCAERAAGWDLGPVVN